MKNNIFSSLAAAVLLLLTTIAIAPPPSVNAKEAESISGPAKTTNLTPNPDNPIAVSIEGLGQVDG